MKGVSLSFFIHESEKHEGMLLYEWLLKMDKKSGISGGSVFKTISSFGHHGKIHEEHFFELSSNGSLQVLFILPDEKVEPLLARIQAEKLVLFYVLTPVTFGVTKN